MGVKFGREYSDIIQDFMSAVGQVDRFYEFFEMDDSDWNDLSGEEQQECLKTLADDLFYGLGTDPHLHVGAGSVYYDKTSHIIKVYNGQNVIHIVNLV